MPATYYHYQCLNAVCADKESVVVDVRTNNTRPKLTCPLCGQLMSWDASTPANDDGYLNHEYVRKAALRDAAAYALDRADQYEDGSGCWVALADTSHNIMQGEIDDAKRNGDLGSALYDRVDGFKGKPKAVIPSMGVDED
jgi:hypothetical protein